MSQKLGLYIITSEFGCDEIKTFTCGHCNGIHLVKPKEKPETLAGIAACVGLLSVRPVWVAGAVRSKKNCVALNVALKHEGITELAKQLYNLARMTTATVGTGTITLGSAVSGYLSFSSAGAVDGDVISYAIADGTSSEIGTGVYTASGTTLTRFVNRSTNANTAINLSGTAQVFITVRAQDIAPIDGYLFGCTLSTAGSSATFGVAAGSAADVGGNDIMRLLSAYTKTTGAWAVGSGNGAVDTGTIAASTWYHVYLIKRPDTGVVDICTSTSGAVPVIGGNIPSAYTLSRRIGSMKTDGSSNWTAFTQVDDRFYWTVPKYDVSRASSGIIGATATNFVLSVPLGVIVVADIVGWVFATSASGSAWIYPTFMTDQTPSFGALGANLYDPTNGSGTTMSLLIATNTSSQIRARGVTNSKFDIITQGWIDARGRLA